jgi:hypothetical protein
MWYYFRTIEVCHKISIHWKGKTPPDRGQLSEIWRSLKRGSDVDVAEGYGVL